MAKVDDLSRSPTALEQSETLISVVELSRSSWLVGAVVPGVALSASLCQRLQQLGLLVSAITAATGPDRTRSVGGDGLAARRVSAASDAGGKPGQSGLSLSFSLHGIPRVQHVGGRAALF